MNIFRVTTLLSLLLTGCKDDAFDPRLEGVWKPNREMTFSELDESKHPPEMVKYLKEHLGEIGFIFKKNKMAIKFFNEDNSTLEFKKYDLITRSENSVTLTVEVEDIEALEVTLYFIGDCFYSTAINNYREYICKLQ